MRAVHLVPHTVYGAFRLPLGIATKLGLPDWSRAWIQAVLTGLMAFGAWRSSPGLYPGLLRLGKDERIFLTVGAILIVGCFMAGPSNGYRSIYFLLVLPAFIGLAADNQLARTTVVLILVVLWSDAVREVDGGLG